MSEGNTEKRSKSVAGTPKIQFVTGKGGVGKSLVAAGHALSQARLGRKVLLVEIGEVSFFKDFWTLPEVTHEPKPSSLGFDLALWSGESCLRDYVLHLLKVERLYRVFFENKAMRSLLSVAPGLSEISILGKITSGVRQVGSPLAYDLIVVDAYASGHAMAMFRTPKGLMSAMPFGPMGHQSRDIHAVLKNPELCGYCVVTQMEELPVIEAIELGQALRDELGVEPELIVNKVFPLPVSEAKLLDLQNGLKATISTQSPEVGLNEFVGYLLSISERQQRYSLQLEEHFAVCRRIPLIFSDQPDVLTKEVAAALDGGPDVLHP